jgi:hypothetical protein
MSEMSRSLIESMKYLLPESQVKQTIRLQTLPERRLNCVADVLAELPRRIVRKQLERVSAPTVMVCLVETNHLISFTHPNWFTAAFSKKIEPEWLNDDGREIYNYCLDNGLAPHFSELNRTTTDLHWCTIQINWQIAGLDDLLGLRQHPRLSSLFTKQENQAPTHIGTRIDVKKLRQRSESVGEEIEAEQCQRQKQFDQDMDEESAEVALALIPNAVQNIEAAAAKGKCEASIYIGSGGVSHDQIFGDGLNSNGAYRDLKLLNKPTCLASVQARGLSLWAQAQGFAIELRVRGCRTYGARPILELCVSW